MEIRNVVKGSGFVSALDRKRLRALLFRSMSDPSVAGETLSHAASQSVLKQPVSTLFFSDICAKDGLLASFAPHSRARV